MSESRSNLLRSRLPGMNRGDRELECARFRSSAQANRLNPIDPLSSGFQILHDQNFLRTGMGNDSCAERVPASKRPFRWIYGLEIDRQVVARSGNTLSSLA